ncbi:MAG: hypothetical protein ACYDHY_06985 [Acidiferrobacterales bacterium]
MLKRLTELLFSMSFAALMIGAIYETVFLKTKYFPGSIEAGSWSLVDEARADEGEKVPVIGECVKPCEWALHQGFMLFKASLKKDGHCLCVGILPNAQDEKEETK